MMSCLRYQLMKRIIRLLWMWRMKMKLERTGDGRWWLKDTVACGDTDFWLKLIEEDSDEDDEFPLPGA